MLEGSVAVLRAPLPADREFLFALRNDLELQSALLALPRPNSMERVAAWIETRLGATDGAFFIIAPKASGEAAGFLQLQHMDFVHGHVELGICLGAAFRGRGLAREALHLAACYARDVFNLRKIILSVVASNIEAVALYEQAGYRRVGIHLGHFYHRQQWHDVLVMEKLLGAAE